MAVIRPILGELNGAVGNVVFSHGKGGAIARRRTIPTNATHTTQLLRRRYLTRFSRAYAALTANQKAEWAVWAANNPQPNRLGEVRQLSGHQAFVQLNTRRQTIGQTTTLVTPPASPMVPPLKILTVTATTPAQKTITWSPSPIPANTYLVQWMAVPTTTGRSPGLAEAILINARTPGSTSPAVGTYIQHPWQVGQRVTLWIATYMIDGRAYPPQRYQITIIP